MSEPAGGAELPDDDERPGLAAERTELAWSRTALSLAALAAVVLRRVWEQLDTVTARVAVLGLLVACGAAWLAVLWWPTTAERPAQDRPLTGPDGPRALRRMTIVTVAFAAVSLGLALAPAPG